MIDIIQTGVSSRLSLNTPTLISVLALDAKRIPFYIKQKERAGP